MEKAGGEVFSQQLHHFKFIESLITYFTRVGEPLLGCNSWGAVTYFKPHLHCMR